MRTSDLQEDTGLNLSYGLNLSSIESSPQDSDQGETVGENFPSFPLADIIPSSERTFGSVEEFRSLQKVYV